MRSRKENWSITSYTQGSSFSDSHHKPATAKDNGRSNKQWWEAVAISPCRWWVEKVSCSDKFCTLCSQPNTLLINCLYIVWTLKKILRSHPLPITPNLKNLLYIIWWSFVLGFCSIGEIWIALFFFWLALFFWYWFVFFYCFYWIGFTISALPAFIRSF